MNGFFENFLLHGPLPSFHLLLQFQLFQREYLSAMFVVKLILCSIIIMAVFGENMDRESTNNGTGTKADPEVIVVQEEDDAFLDCGSDSHRYDPSYISWGFGKNEDSIKFSRYKETINRFVVKDAKPRKSGFYVCVFYGGKKLGHKHWFKLVVKGR